MSVESGHTLSHYRLVEKIGEGGMGVVWKAEDTTLHREVAIKILPEVLSQDPERRARLDREAKLLASLNHSNIATIHGMDESSGIRFLVMELVQGETLAERLESGPLSMVEALTLCCQIAEALEAAHEKGIIHRDLKPANLKVTPGGKVKVLDFGLAKAFDRKETSDDMSQSPTITTCGTRAGVLLGTAAYMSPEQARGKPVDKRTDIWAFGCLFYEMLTGRQAFAGETVSDTIALILEHQPDWQALPAHTSPVISGLLRRCLRKDQQARLHDIADVRIEIEDALTIPADVAKFPNVPSVARGAWGRLLPWFLASGMAVLSGLALWFPRKEESPHLHTIRFAISHSEGPFLLSNRPPALSPDGTHLVYVAGREQSQQIFLRPLDSLEATPVPGTEGAASPFFSPDGKWIGFFSNNKIKKVSIAGGRPLVLCDAEDTFGASWGPGDTILFSKSWGSGLFRVSARGGKPHQVTSLNVEAGEGAHIWPQMLPGGKEALFTIWTGASFDEARIALVSLETGEHRILIEGGTDAHFIPTGHLVFGRSGSLFAVPFDRDRLEVKGNSTLVLDGVLTGGTNGAVQYTISDQGSLVYVPGGLQLPARKLLRVNRDGHTHPIMDGLLPQYEPRLSPDGKKLAITVQGGTFHVWIYDVERGTRTRLTYEADNGGAIWTPDGKRLTFWSNQSGSYNIFWKPADGSSGAEQLLATDSFPFPSSWSPDGKLLTFTESHTDTGLDIWLFEREGEPVRRPLISTRFDEWGARISPDGRWFAYVSNESGRKEVYVQALHGAGGKWQISTKGGGAPIWSANGEELFYRNEEKMMAVSVTTGDRFSTGSPVFLFAGEFLPGAEDSTHYDVSPDGQWFVMLKEDEQNASSTQLIVVLNWFDELERLVPTAE